MTFPHDVVRQQPLALLMQTCGTEHVLYRRSFQMRNLYCRPDSIWKIGYVAWLIIQLPISVWKIEIPFYIMLFSQADKMNFIVVIDCYYTTLTDPNVKGFPARKANTFLVGLQGVDFSCESIMSVFSVSSSGIFYNAI